MSLTKALIVSFVAALVLSSGCRYVDDPIELQATDLPGMRPPPRPLVLPSRADSTIGNRFTSASEEPVDSESATRWSEKYENLSEKYTTLTEENLALTKENNELKKRLMAVEEELGNARTELADANLFLQDMHKELTQWKGDVLGFRSEMRNADSAQLNALTKILKLLGAETTEPIAMNASDQTGKIDSINK